MSKKLINNRPKFQGGNLRQWAVETALPWLVENLNLVAGVVCGSLDESLRRQVYNLGPDETLPEPIDWERNGIVISPPGTGKGVAIFVEALNYFERAIVIVPSVIQAHKLEASLDFLYDTALGGCHTSQRKAKGLIQIVTTVIFHQMVNDKSSDLWKSGTVLIVDEAQRVIDEDLRTEMLIGYATRKGVRTMIVSATIAPGRLPGVYGHQDQPAKVYELDKQMHPIDLEVVHGAKPDKLLKDLPVLREKGNTILVFAPSRREIARVTHLIRDEESLDVWAIPVTGAHLVEEQLTAISRAQETGKTVVVVATPGTMDSSVTIPGLETVIIIDRRIRVDWNKHGVVERWSERLPINHIWQMVRRVGREARADGKRDKCIIVGSSDRPDVTVDKPVFDALSGCSPYSPIEGLLLEAVALNIPFDQVHRYMLSTFSQERIEAGIVNILDHQMVEKVDDPSDPDGFRLTRKGIKVNAMPYDYKWSRFIIEAPRDLRLWLALGASFGRLADLEMFENTFQVEANKMSEIVRKINLGVEYVGLMYDQDQRIRAEASDLSFRRMEQTETIFDLGCQAMGLEWSMSDLVQPEGERLERLLEYIVLDGLRVGLFELFLPAKGDKGGWSEPRHTADLPEGRFRRFFLDEGGLDLKGNVSGGVVAIVAGQQWFTSRSGSPLGNLENPTIVPQNLVRELVDQMAEQNGWFELTFSVGEYRGQPQMESEWDGIKYIASRPDNDPEPGMPYWCSVDREFGFRRKSVCVHYPSK